jgi:hypothetical protein
MKKFINSLLTVSLLSAAISVKAFTLTIQVLPGAMTNALAGFNNPVSVNMVAITANTTNASAVFVDTPTNALSYVLPAYSNSVYYVTNYYVTYTNYYGVVQNTYTNLVQIDVTNSVPSTTNQYNQPLAIATLASTASTYYNLTAVFNRGMWITNNSSGIATLTVTYH